MQKFVPVFGVTFLYCIVEFWLGVSIPLEFYLLVPYVTDDDNGKKNR